MECGLPQLRQLVGAAVDRCIGGANGAMAQLAEAARRATPNTSPLFRSKRPRIGRAGTSSLSRARLALDERGIRTHDAIGSRKRDPSPSPISDRLARVGGPACTAAFSMAGCPQREGGDIGATLAMPMQSGTRHTVRQTRMPALSAAYRRRQTRPGKAIRDCDLHRRGVRTTGRPANTLTGHFEPTEPSLRRLELTAQLGHNPEYAFVNARRRCGGDFQ